MGFTCNTEGKDVLGDAVVDTLGCMVVLEVFVISDYGNMVHGTHEEVAPMFQAMDNGKEFSVPDRVVVLSL